MPGPIPKRSTERRRRNKPVLSLVKSAAGERFDWPAVPEEWHPIAKLYYSALQSSGMAAFHEPTDVADAFMHCELISRAFSGPRTYAQLILAIDAAMARHGVTEADRRRLQIELQRHPEFVYPGLAEWKARHGS